MASRAAKSKRGRSSGRIAELHSRLEHVAERVEAGTLETSRGAVIIQAIGQQIRLLEQERKQRETEEFEERISRLEAVREERDWRGA